MNESLLSLVALSISYFELFPKPYLSLISDLELAAIGSNSPSAINVPIMLCTLDFFVLNGIFLSVNNSFAIVSVVLSL
jgi:hypothetical protein